MDLKAIWEMSVEYIAVYLVEATMNEAKTEVVPENRTGS